MTPQEIFDKVRTHLLSQMDRAYEMDRCQYRTKGGLKCAIGCLIPDEMYDPEFEGKTVEQLIVRYPVIKSLLGEDNRALLGSLQYVHDCRDPRDRERLLREADQKLRETLGLPPSEA